MKCRGIEIDHLYSGYKDPATIEVDLKGVGTVHPCTANYLFKSSISTISSGRVTLGVGSDSELSAGIRILEDHGMMVGANLSSCDSAITFPSSEMEFSGSLTADIINLFTPQLSRELESVANPAICAGLDTFLAVNATESLQKLNARLEPLTHVHPSPVPIPPAGVHLVNWEDNRLLGLMNLGLESILGPDGCRGGVDTIIDKLTDGTGEVDVPVFKDVSLAVGTIGNVTMGISWVNISGLDSFSAMHLLEAHDSYSIKSSLVLDHINITVGVIVRYPAFFRPARPVSPVAVPSAPSVPFALGSPGSSHP